MFHKVWKEWFESKKDDSLGKIELVVNQLPPSLDQIFQFSTGRIHLQITKEGFPQPTQPTFYGNQTNIQQPPTQQSYQHPPQQYQQPPTYQSYNAPPLYPQLYPSMQQYQQPPMQQYQLPPQQQYQQPPMQQYQLPPQQQYQQPPQQQYQAPYYDPSFSPNAPPEEKEESPVLPPKVTLPTEVADKTVLCNTSNAVQNVTEEILRNYLKFCGEISYLQFKKYLL